MVAAMAEIQFAFILAARADSIASANIILDFPDELGDEILDGKRDLLEIVLRHVEALIN